MKDQHKNEMKVIKTKTCKMCGETKPREDFRRRLTKRQSASLLRRQSVSIAITVISNRCRHCWAHTKRKTPLTIKQIKNKKASGDLHGVVADILLKYRKDNATAIKSRVMKEYWETKRTEPIKALKKNLQQQVAKYKNRYHAFKSRMKTEAGENSLQENQTNQKNQKNQTKQHAMLSQHRANYEMARRVRDELMERAKAGEAIDVNVVMAKFFTKGESDVGLD